MTLNTKFLPTIGMKIRSSFNNARKSNVGFSSCEIMKRVYRNATLEQLTTKIEAKEGQIEDLKNNISNLEDDMQSKLNESSEFYTVSQGVLENTSDMEDKVKLNKEIATTQNAFSKDMGKIGRKINSEQKKLSRAEESLSIFEQLKEEAEKQEIERQKEEENQRLSFEISNNEEKQNDNQKEDKRLNFEMLTNEMNFNEKSNSENLKEDSKLNFEILKNENQNDNYVTAESNIELPNINLENVEKKEDNMENKQTDPIENLKSAFDNFISQISKEREE